MVTLSYDISNFKGFANTYGATAGTIIKCDNFDASFDSNATSIYHSFLTKFPLAGTLGDTISTSISRGLYLFIPGKFSDSGIYRYMQAFSDGTMRYYDNSLNIWTTINSSFNTNYPFIFATYPANDTLYWANGSEGVYKWKLSWSAGTRLRNKGGVVSTITGTLNFLEDSTIVTGTSGTIFLTELIPGDWIRKDSSEDWYEVETVNSDSILNLSSIYVETTGPGIDDQSEKAPLWGKEGRFVNIWKDRLYVAAGATYYDLLKEDGDSLLQESGYKILVS